MREAHPKPDMPQPHRAKAAPTSMLGPKVIPTAKPAVAPSLVWGRTADRPLDERVRHELNMLPFFSVFDYMTYRVDGDKVILAGVAANTVPGVFSVTNNLVVDAS